MSVAVRHVEPDALDMLPVDENFGAETAAGIRRDEPD